MWLLNNWDSVISILTGVVAVASIVAKLTPTETDDALIARILKIVDFLAINNKPTELKEVKP